MKIFYLGARFTKDSDRALHQLRDHWHLTHTALPKTGFHSTIIYSRAEFQLPGVGLPMEELFLVKSAQILRSSIVLPFGYTGHWLTELHRACLRNGATQDYPEYTPHVTIAEFPTPELAQAILENISNNLDMIPIKVKEIYYAEFEEREKSVPCPS